MRDCFFLVLSMEFSFAPRQFSLIEDAFELARNNRIKLNQTDFVVVAAAVIEKLKSLNWTLELELRQAPISIINMANGELETVGPRASRMPRGVEYIVMPTVRLKLPRGLPTVKVALELAVSESRLANKSPIVHPAE